MKADAVARKIAEIFEETDAGDVTEVSVGVTDAKALTAALKRLGFDVKAVSNTVTVSRGTRRAKPDRANEKRD